MGRSVDEDGLGAGWLPVTIDGRGIQYYACSLRSFGYAWGVMEWS